MNSQTARRSNQRPRSARSAKTKKYTRQTAHVEARRDGKPLIFGWGGHLSRSEKVRLQRRAIWTLTITIALIVVFVIAGYWTNVNVISPNLAITSVNGQNVPQSDFRKLIALKTQFELNKFYGPNGLIAQQDDLKKQISDQQKSVDDTKKQIEGLEKQIKELPAGQSANRSELETQLKDNKTKLDESQKKLDTVNGQFMILMQGTIPNEQQLFTRPQYANESADWLQQDIFIRQWLTKQNNTLKAQVEPNAAAIDRALKDFQANIPKSSSYQKFLDEDRVSDSDVRAMLALKLRRENMQAFLSSQIKTPAYHVLARGITVSTEAEAKNILQQLKDKKADFGKLAKEKSVDSTTNQKGGDFGWMAYGQYTLEYGANVSGKVNKWIFDPGRKIDELSPIILENGTYHIIQITGIDPSRTIEDAMLKRLQTNATNIWTLNEKASPGVNVTPIDQDKILDPANMPPGLPASAPGQQQQGFPGQ